MHVLRLSWKTPSRLFWPRFWPNSRLLDGGRCVRPVPRLFQTSYKTIFKHVLREFGLVILCPRVLEPPFARPPDKWRRGSVSPCDSPYRSLFLFITLTLHSSGLQQGGGRQGRCRRRRGHPPCRARHRRLAPPERRRRLSRVLATPAGEGPERHARYQHQPAGESHTKGPLKG